MMIPAVARALSERCHLKPGDSVLAAVSGGGDSVALLRLLIAWQQSSPLSVTVVHVNHGLRGRESTQDQRFVASLGRQLGVEVVSHKSDHGPGASEEELRESRHTLFRKTADETGCSHIALGHTLDDQAETVIMRMLRGSGRRGLSGMSFTGPGRLIRPMLGLRRSEVREYLKDLGQPWREDRTNIDPRFLRNRIRASLLPHLEGFNPSIIPVLGRAAEVLTQEDLYLEQLASDFLADSLLTGGEAGELSVPVEGLCGIPVPLARRAVRILLERAGGEPRGASFQAVERLLEMAASPESPPGGESLGGGMRGARRGLFLHVWKEAGEPPGTSSGFRCEMAVPGIAHLERGVLEATVMPRSGAEPIPEGPDRVALDADLLGNNVTIRTRVPGDVFHPFGGPGRRKLKRFLIDQKVPRYLRDGIPLVEGPRGIAWVVGERIGHPYRLTGRTTRVAVLEYRPTVDPADS